MFKQGGIKSLDAETLFTIQRFSENNLNVSKTSRGLFIAPQHAGVPPGEDQKAHRAGLRAV